jgi:hypothetical protein
MILTRRIRRRQSREMIIQMVKHWVVWTFGDVGPGDPPFLVSRFEEIGMAFPLFNPARLARFTPSLLQNEAIRIAHPAGVLAAVEIQSRWKRVGSLNSSSAPGRRSRYTL